MTIFNLEVNLKYIYSIFTKLPCQETGNSALRYFFIRTATLSFYVAERQSTKAVNNQLFLVFGLTNPGNQTQVSVSVTDVPFTRQFI